MPAPWSKPLEVERVSRGRAAFEFDIALEDLPRLVSRTERTGGTVRGTVRFGRQGGIAVAEVLMHGAAVLRCQRCMQPLALPVDSVARVALLTDAGAASTVPEPFEPVLAPTGRISVGELVEEELLLSLPIVPLHGAGGECESAALAGVNEAPADATTQRPFAALSELLSQK